MSWLVRGHLGDGGHIVIMGVRCQHGRIPERLALRHLQVRRPRVHAGTARGPARTSGPDHERGARACRDPLLFRDEANASAVYADVVLGGPVRQEEVAECVLFALTRPVNANVDEIVFTALASPAARGSSARSDGARWR